MYIAAKIIKGTFLPETTCIINWYAAPNILAVLPSKQNPDNPSHIGLHFMKYILKW